MELNKLCRTCLSASENMTSLYETCATATQNCCAEMLSSFTPLICCKDDGLSTMICHNCVREVNRCHTFRLKCLESDRVLRKHVPRVIGVAATNITVTNEQTESRNQHSIKLEADMDEDSCITEEAEKAEFPTSSKKKITAKSLKDTLSIAEMAEDLNQVLDIVKHELDVVDIKIEKDDDINIDVNHAPANEQKQEKPPNSRIRLRSHTRHQLAYRTRIHTEDKLYTCSICNKTFKHLHHLKYHRRTHTGEKPHSCTVCDSSFAQPSNLTIHMRTHTGERPYPCTVCDRAFTQPSNLTRHMRRHASEKPYPCTQCDSLFNSKRSLTIHMRKHSGEKS